MLLRTIGLISLINRLAMDLLSPLFKHVSPSVQYYFSGIACEGGAYDGKDPWGHLHLVRSGSMQLDVSGAAPLHIVTPTVLLFPRPCAHRMTPAQGGVELVCGQVDLGLAEQNPLALSLPAWLAIPLADLPAAGATLELLYQEAVGSSIGRQTAISRLLDYFLIQVLRHLLAQGRFSDGVLAAMADPRLALAFNAMHEHPANPWTLEQLADLAHMSRARFAANFHKLAGIPPLEYLTHWRLSVARGLLRKGRPLKSVASAVGYQSPEAFGRAFARRIGHTPAEWVRGQLSLMPDHSAKAAD
jgi:AraC-like DNA-binding protein